VDGRANLRPVQTGQAGAAHPATRHGCYAIDIPARARELADELRALLPASSPSDDPTVALVAMVLARVEVANAWIDEHGLMDAKGRPQPILRVLPTWENTAARLLDRLGLTPTSRAALGLNIARAHEAGIADLIEEGRKVRERAEAS
jgi:post-segregation antitoxin (ccd killing protein)